MNERDIFTQALEIHSPTERAAFLAQVCGHDAGLRSRVEGLLAEREKLGGYLEVPAAAVVTIDQPPANRPGMRIGRFRLMEQIGEGGMGTVWVAEQTEPVKRRVALKLIKPGMDSRQVLSRFEAERQALALMDHPNIAKFIDAGMVGDGASASGWRLGEGTATSSPHPLALATSTSHSAGRPYFVMEYVKGVPITEYCDNAKLPIRERLKLFVQVCQAVQHAHQKGVIHRDLKPSNILVCLYDGVPVPKVIDFGLAKATSQPLTEHTLYTAHGLMVGTPLYMSPEQAEFNNLDVDTRTDIYSLGVLLYELLTGTTPLEKQQFKDAALNEILRLIKEVEPPKPSTRLSKSGSPSRSGPARQAGPTTAQPPDSSLDSIAASRGVEPAQLSRLVRGDLDWIVMKALEKERNRRYETANSLARDIERHLQDQPVEAGPPSVRYRVGKFARRNQIALATTALVLAALCLGGGLSAAMSFEARTARLLAEQRRRVHLESYVQIMWGGKIIHEVAQRRLQLDESTKDVLNRFASLANQAPLSSNEQLASVRAELLRGVLDFWDQAIRLDTGKDGEAIGRAYFYRIQRLLCLARAGEHRQAAQEAEAVWRQMQLPPGKPSISLASDPKDSVNIQSSGAPFNRAANDLKTFVSTGYGGVPASESSGDLEYDFARVYALCAVAVKSEPLLARQYSDRAMDFLRFASEADFFKAPSRSVRLASDGDLGTLREREDFLELLAGVQARLR